ncbi:hypothetical protein BDZ91DRAFT_750515 [Kalaharituber pfeilii]|nr:hypothetical protein BDZ91DRAFT_750515 [Kalaharituber pfeilii]
MCFHPQVNFIVLLRRGVAMLCALFFFTCFPMEALRWLRIMGGGAWGPRTAARGAASAISLEWP